MNTKRKVEDYIGEKVAVLVQRCHWHAGYIGPQHRRASDDVGPAVRPLPFRCFGDPCDSSLWRHFTSSRLRFLPSFGCRNRPHSRIGRREPRFRYHGRDPNCPSHVEGATFDPLREWSQVVPN